jgi:hypothetical protein
MKKFLILLIAALALLGCAGNKPAEQAKVLTCDAFFYRINDLQKRFEENGRGEEFKARLLMMKWQFPYLLEDGTPVYCSEKITCDDVEYCYIRNIKGKNHFIL